MKIYRVDINKSVIVEPVPGETEILLQRVHLVWASSAAKARNHVLKAVLVRVASQADLLMAVGEDAIEIEEAQESR